MKEEDVRQHYVSVHLYDLYCGLLKMLELFSYLSVEVFLTRKAAKRQQTATESESRLKCHQSMKGH